MNKKVLEEKLLRMVEEDLGSGDITTEFAPRKRVRAEIISNNDCIVSGIYELRTLFNLFNIEVLESVNDGDKVKKREKIFILSGDSNDILLVERTALNILSRMSGITTLTSEFIRRVKRINPEIRVAATRKITPLFGYFEKRAVKIAGGDPHRSGLYDLVLIKDNHLKLFKNVREAIRMAKRKASFTHKIEIEVNNVKDAVTSADEGADIIMLDNMSVEQVKDAVSKLREKNLREKVILEVSGGITLDNISDYSRLGVDVISIGRLTHSAPAQDFSLKIL
ncbi:MAG: carboxylating nicotinate-nucleotide diphosphorylase [Candidatus Altiarchaeales archaeon]|nr:MAG: carboxylating nicotinate-nucleotide diphosphorylase [Candidatus Altiarchaeales archaeon]